MNKKTLTEADIRTKFITPALDKDKQGLGRHDADPRGALLHQGPGHRPGPDRHARRSEEGRLLLFYKPNIPIAVIEAKDNNHTVGDGMQQALDYAETLDVPFVFSSNGDAFLEHDRTAGANPVEREIPLDEFPSPGRTLAALQRLQRATPPQQQAVVTQDYYDDGSGKKPRYYQLIAINRTVEAIAKGQDRILLVMATGTGKTYTAFQIIWRLWKAGAKKRILFLADRNILVDQTKINDFKPFGQAMTKITNRTVDKSYEIYLCALPGRHRHRGGAATSTSSSRRTSST